MKTYKTNWLLFSGIALALLLLGVAYFNRVEAVNSVTFFWRAEGTTLDGTHDFSAGDTTATLNASAALNTDAVKIGTNGLDSASNDSYAEFAVSSNDIISNVEGAIGFWFRYVTWNVSHFHFLAQQTGQAANNIAIFSAGTDDATGREITLRVRRAGVSNVSITTTDADLQTNTWYFLVARWDEPNSDMRIEVYNDNGSLRHAFENLTTNFDQPQGLDVLRIGDSLGAGGTFDHHLDNIFIASDYSEPLENKMNITSWTEYEGGASIPPVKIRGGTSVRGGVNFR